jgi:thiamine biosynthesis lipoprotein ApbE
MMHTSSKHNTTSRRAIPWVLLFCFLAITFGSYLYIQQLTLKEQSQAGQTDPPDTVFKRQFPIFGTFAKLTFWGDNNSATQAATKISSALRNLHDTVNLFDSDSELSRLNQQAFKEPFSCSQTLWDILSAARLGYSETAGAFDITVAPLMALWGFHRKRDSLPTQAEITETLNAVGLNKVVFDDAQRTVRFTHPKTELDLGGIAKGYALDQTRKICREKHIYSGMIDLGGNIYTLPMPPPGKKHYSIGIRHPFSRDHLLTTIQIRNRCIATSGNYENQRTIQKKTITHIIDPRTGHPVADVASVTVVTPKGVDSDIFSTAIFVGGESMANRLKAIRQQTSILRVTLDAKGQAQISKFGWQW